MEVLEENKTPAYQQFQQSQTGEIIMPNCTMEQGNLNFPDKQPNG